MRVFHIYIFFLKKLLLKIKKKNKKKNEGKYENSKIRYTKITKDITEKLIYIVDNRFTMINHSL